MKPKQIHKTKEQLIHEAHNKKEIDRKKKIILEDFYPALIAATVSVDESKALMSALSTLLMEEVLKTMKERQFSEVAKTILDRLTTDGERTDKVARLLNALAGENLFVAREIIEGMTRAIEVMITEEMRERTLDTLKTNWETYLN